MNLPVSDNPRFASALFGANRVLFVGAHPDDIEFYCGGLVYQLRKAGVEVYYLIATKGGKGRRGRAGRRLEELRTQHQSEAAAILGGAHVTMLDYPDGHLANHIEALSSDIQSHVELTRPDFIFCWDARAIYNPHPDHQAAADACHAALDATDTRVVYYGTREANAHIGIDEESYRAKMASLRAHRTETPWYYWPIVSRDIRKRLRLGAQPIGCKHAEVFRPHLYM